MAEWIGTTAFDSLPGVVSNENGASACAADTISNNTRTPVSDRTKRLKREVMESPHQPRTAYTTCRCPATVARHAATCARLLHTSTCDFVWRPTADPTLIVNCGD